MITKNKLFEILSSPHVSEKSNRLLKKSNVIVLKVLISSTKSEIKLAIQKLFSVNIKCINTVLVKGKVKKHNRYNVYRKNWKKAYVTLQKGQKLDFINHVL
ncbi:50S ribosomal protein L23 [Buchnera aphidicola]|uniref:50S ribosomal protein L23 n=1 Tax=Buchnera aphidicola TaxID=9 RepID=UPI0031B83614